MTLKIDLEKAFDRLNWDFIANTLKDARIPVYLQRVIMQCITSPSMQVLWNKHPSSVFHPQRGIRQGDPLSPLLFVLCMERLSQAICHEFHDGAWKAIKLRKGEPSLSHLFFADDLLLFNLAHEDQALFMQMLLQEFLQVSGLKVNAAKTQTFFSQNVPSQLATHICSVLGFQRTEQLGKYLGVPILHKRVTKETYQYVEERVRLKLQGWKARSLYLARRITVAQSVLSAIVYYPMQTSKLPNTTCGKYGV